MVSGGCSLITMRAKVYRLVKPKVGWLSALSGLSFTLAGFQVSAITGLVVFGVVCLVAEWRIT